MLKSINIHFYGTNDTSSMIILRAIHCNNILLILLAYASLQINPKEEYGGIRDYDFSPKFLHMFDIHMYFN